jgi:peptidylprolyl isomerase/peptidyl-prolyl cis-trans isomerase D
MNTVRVSDGEVREAYRQRNHKVNAKYIFFDANKVSLEEIEISDSEIDNYYREQQDEYQVPEQRKIEYVLFEGKPSAEDSAQVWKDIQDILQRIQAGADFEEMAKESDDEGSRDKGGDLGFFGRGDMVKPFEEAAFSAKVGEVVGPVETQHGLHIIQTLARKTEDGETSVHARHILLKYKTSPETYDDLNDRAKYFYDEASNSQSKYFTEIAEQEGLALKESPLFQKGGFVPGIGMAARINLFAFQEKLNWVSPPMSSGDNIIVFRISEIQKSHIRPLEEVESTIRNSIQREKQKNKAGDNCGQVWQKIDGGMAFEQAASEDSLEIQETGLIQLQSYVSGIGRDAGFSGTAFKLEVGDVSGPVEGTRGYYLIKVIDRTEVDEETMNSDEIESIKQELYRSKQQQMFAAWYNDLKEKAQIEDYRDQFF